MSAKLTVALEEGFYEEHVVVAINGRVHYDAEKVTTRLQIGRADFFETEVEPGDVTITVSVPEQGISEDIPEKVHDELAIGISLDEGKIIHRRTPFQYA